MGSLQVRLLVTYFFVIAVTLGLAALSLLLQLGEYRDSISYGNLEDMGRLVNSQASLQIQLAEGGATLPGDEPEPGGETGAERGKKLLADLNNFFNNSAMGTVSRETTVAIIDPAGRVLPGFTTSSADLDGSVVRDLTDQRTDDPLTAPRRCRLERPTGPDILCVSIPLGTEVLDALEGTEASAIIVARPAASLGEIVGDLAPRLVFSGIIGVAAALVLGFALSQSVAAPLRNIARAARSVARGNYRQRVPATGPREVRDLAANFNRMTEEVQRSQQTLRDFLANISHELKTPLTSIRGFSEAMLDGTIDDQVGIERSAKIISDESNRVLRLVQELLDLSRIESGQVSMQQDDIDLHELFEHVGEVFALRSEESGVELDISVLGRAHVRGDFDRLEQVMNNLLDNAFRHTPTGGGVKVACRDLQPGTLQVTVADTGPGIPPNDLPHMFERFYRGENHNESSRKGYGLGLAISREIVRAHGGEIWATSEPGSGTTFVFTLPTAGRARLLAGAR
ncbi:MAG: HAMP domain-containing sensor histidine kinase [Tepidiformaceae bacterium]